MRCIGISGTPGTGKTIIAKELSSILHIPFIDLSNFVLENRLYLYYDEVRESYVVDEDRVRDKITAMYRNSGAMIIASHYIEILPKELFELIIVLRRNPFELINILKQRGWPDSKIAENIEAELLSMCTLNVLEEFGEEIVVEIDITNKSINEIVDEIANILYGTKSLTHGLRIDWASLLDEEKLNMLLEYIERNRA